MDREIKIRLVGVIVLFVCLFGIIISGTVSVVSGIKSYFVFSAIFFVVLMVIDSVLLLRHLDVYKREHYN